MFNKMAQSAKLAMTANAQEIAPGEAYKVYGTPAKSMQDKGFQKKAGKANISAGAKGEQILFQRMRQPGGWVPADTPVFCSMRVPGLSESDIDFAIVRGNKILLIDAKMYKQSGGFWWNLFDRTKFNIGMSSYKSKNGKPIKLSRSMIAAKEILSRELNKHGGGYEVEAIVVMTCDPENPRAKKPTTWAMQYPGGVKVYNDTTAPRFIRRFLGGSVRDTNTHNAERYLRNLVQ